MMDGWLGEVAIRERAWKEKRQKRREEFTRIETHASHSHDQPNYLTDVQLLSSNSFPNYVCLSLGISAVPLRGASLARPQKPRV
jgi:hypothetical protein